MSDCFATGISGSALQGRRGAEAGHPLLWMIEKSGCLEPRKGSQVPGFPLNEIQAQRRGKRQEIVPLHILPSGILSSELSTKMAGQ
jgi:hypothetical protein